jgi:hypothetical protein
LDTHLSRFDYGFAIGLRLSFGCSFCFVDMHPLKNRITGFYFLGCSAL